MPGSRVLTAVLTAAVLLLCAAAASGAVSTGHSGWGWASPTPQGEDLQDVVFSGSGGYAVGGFGTILRTADAGETWTGLASGTTSDLGRVGAAGPGGIVVSGGCALRRSDDAGTSFRTIDVGGDAAGCGTSVAAVAFADAQSGMILFSNGVVLSTADGGVTLSRRTPVPGGAPTGLVMTSPTTAFATSGTSIHRTTDSGTTWTLVATGSRGLRGLTFADASVGYAAGDSGTVLKTVDGGATWSEQPSPGAPLQLTGVRCAGPTLCLFTTPSSTLVRTDDGAATYRQIAASAGAVNAVAFASPSRVIGVGAGGTTVVSDDGGLTWREVSRRVATPLTVVSAGSGDFAYGWGPTAIAMTLDGGATWREVGIPTPIPIRTAAFADPLTGFALDEVGTLRRTRDGGNSWQVLDAGAVPGNLQRILALDASRVIVVADGGLLRSADGGTTLRPVDSPVVRRSAAVRRTLIGVAGTGRRAFVIGRAGIIETRDAGVTWRRIRLPRLRGRTPTIAAGDCAAPAACWIVTTGSRAYRTVDGGRRWEQLTAAIGVPMRTVAGVSAVGPGSAMLMLRNTPSVGAPEGAALATSDGGRTWAPQVVARSPLVSVDAIRGRAWALTVGGQVLTTTTGGQAATPSRLTITARPKRVPRGGRVTLTGRLVGAAGGEQVGVYVTGRPPVSATVSSGGTFTLTLRLRRSVAVVAQWAGDGARAGTGTPVLVLRPR